MQPSRPPKDMPETVAALSQVHGAVRPSALAAAAAPVGKYPEGAPSVRRRRPDGPEQP